MSIDSIVYDNETSVNGSPDEGGIRGRISLSDRLMMIASQIGPEQRVADIGTDHGYLPIWLISSNAARHVIITDVNKGPLEKAANNLKKYDIAEAQDLRLGSGLSVLKPGEADVIVIAGMGGILISRILDADPEVVSEAVTLILQPRNHSFSLRHYLKELDGFVISNEMIAREGRRFSEIITVKRRNMLDKDDLFRIEKAEQIKKQLGLPERITEEVSPMIFCDINETVSDYIKMKIHAENIVIDNIRSNGCSGYADSRLERALARRAAFEKMRSMTSAG